MNLIYNSVEALQGQGAGDPREKRETVLDRPLKAYTEVRAGEYASFPCVTTAPYLTGRSGAHLRTFYTRKKMGRSGTGLGAHHRWNVMQDHGGYVDVMTGHGGNGIPPLLSRHP